MTQDSLFQLEIVFEQRERPASVHGYIGACCLHACRASPCAVTRDTNLYIPKPKVAVAVALYIIVVVTTVTIKSDCGWKCTERWPLPRWVGDDTIQIGVPSYRARRRTAHGREQHDPIYTRVLYTIIKLLKSQESQVAS